MLRLALKRRLLLGEQLGCPSSCAGWDSPKPAETTVVNGGLIHYNAADLFVELISEIHADLHTEQRLIYISLN